MQVHRLQMQMRRRMLLNTSSIRPAPAGAFVFIFTYHPFIYTEHHVIVMATVLVKMNFCSKTHKITVSMREDGDLDLIVDSDCPEVMTYAESLGGRLTMDDISDLRKSKIFDPDNLDKITMTCLAPNGLLSAAWLETGMMSKKMARDVKENVVSFEVV